MPLQTLFKMLTSFGNTRTFLLKGHSTTLTLLQMSHSGGEIIPPALNRWGKIKNKAALKTTKTSAGQPQRQRENHAHPDPAKQMVCLCHLSLSLTHTLPLHAHTHTHARTHKSRSEAFTMQISPRPRRKIVCLWAGLKHQTAFTQSSIKLFTLIPTYHPMQFEESDLSCLLYF